MEKRMPLCCWVDGNEENLNRALLKEEFSKFGKVTKVFVDASNTYAKLYFNNFESVQLAYLELNGQNGWQVKPYRDNYKGHDWDVRSPTSTFRSRSRNSLNQSLGGTSNGKSTLDDMDEDCSFAGDYVDVHGRSVEVLQGENGLMYVNLDDIRTAGYNIYKKESFENATITKDIELRALENYLLNQARKYCIESKKTFNEDEVLGVFERVKAKLQTKSGEFGKGRIVNASPNTKNFTITKSNVTSPAGSRTSKEFVADNFQPSFSHATPSPKGSVYRTDDRPNRFDNRSERENRFENRPERDNRIENLPERENRIENRPERENLFENRPERELLLENRPERENLFENRPERENLFENRPERANVIDNRPERANLLDNRQRDRQMDLSSDTGFRRTNDIPSDRLSEDSAKPVDNNLSFSEVNRIQTNTRKPRPNSENSEAQKNVRSKALADSNANDECEEDWAGTKTPVPKSKPRNDSVSLTSDRKINNIERKLLEPQGTYKLKVCYVKPDKTSVFHAQNVDDLNQIEEILLHVNTTDFKLPIIDTPTRGMWCIAQYEDCWYRAVVVNEKQVVGCYVELIDYGNREIIVAPLRELSPEMKKIPGMAIRLTADQDSNTDHIQMELEIEVFVKKHITDEYDDLTHLVQIIRIVDGPKLDQDPKTPPSELSSDHEAPRKAKTVEKEVAEDCFMEIPPSTVNLTNGEVVMIVWYTETKFILRNKETAMKCKELYTHLDSCKKIPISNPKVGQLVLCSKDGSENMHRAVIKKINNQVADIEYLDHYGGETLALKSLRHVDKLSAGYPVTKVESPDVVWLNAVTGKSDGFLSDLVLNKTKLKVVLDGTKFDLLISEEGNTIPLSKKIEQLENPRKEVPKKAVVTAVPVKSEEAPPPKKQTPSADKAVQDDLFINIKYNDMPFAEATLGEGDYMCYNCKEGSLTLLSSNDAAKHLESLVVDEPIDTVPHNPEPMDMCLGKFEDMWYRALLLEYEDEMCNLLFVDFGNTESIPKTDVRKFPKKFSKIPILGMSAYLVGIPENPQIHERLTKLIRDEEEYKVIIKTELDDTLKYGIEIPAVYAQLKQENLI